MTSCSFFGGMEAKKKTKERKKTLPGSGNASRFARVFEEENNALFTCATSCHRDDER